MAVDMLKLDICLSRHLKFPRCRILMTVNMLHLAINLSVAAYCVTQLKFRPVKRKLGKESDLLREMEVPSSKPSESGSEEKQVIAVDPDVMSEEYNVAEIELLKNISLELQRKEENLQEELLEYYGLMEQEALIIELQRQLKLNSVEIEILNLKIKSLEAEKKKAEEEVAEFSLVKQELESARAKIKDLQRQIKMESTQTEAQKKKVEEEVAQFSLVKKELKSARAKIKELQTHIKIESMQKEAQKKKAEEEVAQFSLVKKELDSARAKIKELQRQIKMEPMQTKDQVVMLKKKLQPSKELEMEVVELRRANKELQLQKQELFLKLDIAENQFASLSKITEISFEKAK